MDIEWMCINVARVNVGGGGGLCFWEEERGYWIGWVGDGWVATREINLILN